MLSPSPTTLKSLSKRLFKQQLCIWHQVAKVFVVKPLLCWWGYYWLFIPGIDPSRSRIFIQSHVRAHAELAWLLNCVTPMNWLERMIQYKEKARKQGENVGMRTDSSLQCTNLSIACYLNFLQAWVYSATRCWWRRISCCIKRIWFQWARTSASTWSSPAISPDDSTTSTARRRGTPSANPRLLSWRKAREWCRWRTAPRRCPRARRATPRG